MLFSRFAATFILLLDFGQIYLLLQCKSSLLPQVYSCIVIINRLKIIKQQGKRCSDRNNVKIQEKRMMARLWSEARNKIRTSLTFFLRDARQPQLTTFLCAALQSAGGLLFAADQHMTSPTTFRSEKGSPILSRRQIII